MFRVHSWLAKYPGLVRCSYFLSIYTGIQGIKEVRLRSTEVYRRRNEFLGLLEEQIDEWKVELEVSDKGIGALANRSGVEFEEKKDSVGETSSNDVLLFRWLETLKDLTGKKSFKEEERKFGENCNRVELKFHECILNRMEKSDEGIGVAPYEVMITREEEEFEKSDDIDVHLQRWAQLQSEVQLQAKKVRKSTGNYALAWARLKILESVLGMEESGGEMRVPLDWVRMSLDEWTEQGMDRRSSLRGQI